MGILKPKFSRRNEIWLSILVVHDLSKNVRKTQDRTSLNIQETCFSWRKKFSQREEICLMPIGITVNHCFTLTRNVEKVKETIEFCLVYSAVMI